MSPAGENDPRTINNANGGDVSLDLELTIDQFDAAVTFVVSHEKQLPEQFARRPGQLLQAVAAHPPRTCSVT